MELPVEYVAAYAEHLDRALYWISFKLSWHENARPFVHSSQSLLQIVKATISNSPDICAVVSIVVAQPYSSISLDRQPKVVQ